MYLDQQLQIEMGIGQISFVEVLKNKSGYHLQVSPDNCLITSPWPESPCDLVPHKGPIILEVRVWKVYQYQVLLVFLQVVL